MKVIVSFIALFITAFLAYWFLSEPKKETPDLVFTSSFSMADIELPEFEVASITAIPSVEVALQTANSVKATLLPEIAIINDVPALEIMPVQNTGQVWLNLNDPKQKYLYFNELLTFNLRQISLKNSHSFFEGLSPLTFAQIDGGLTSYVADGIDESAEIELKRALKNHYQPQLENIKTICGKQKCYGVATVPIYSKFDQSYCKVSGLSKSKCRETLVLDYSEAYFQEKFQQHIECDAISETNFTGYDDQGKKVTQKKFARKLKNKVKKCKKDMSKLNRNFERQLVVEIDQPYSKNLTLQPLMIEEVPLLDTQFGNLEAEMTRYMQRKLSAFKITVPDSLKVSCSDVFCNVNFISHIPLDNPNINLEPYLNIMLWAEYCQIYEWITPEAWSEVDGFDIHAMEMRCVLPKNYASFSH